MSTNRVNSRRFQNLRDAFYEEGKHLDANPATRAQANCWLCNQRIDYDADPGTTPDSHELDHYHTVTDRPDLQEDPSNFRHAHRLCNGKRGRRTPMPGLGHPIPDWW